jgi:hypothetical protein
MRKRVFYLALNEFSGTVSISRSLVINPWLGFVPSGVVQGSFNKLSRIKEYGSLSCDYSPLYWKSCARLLKWKV